MLLKSLILENFKGIRERQRIELAPVTMLYGPNSAGKSTVLQALIYLKEIIERENLNPHQTVLGGDHLDLGGFENLVHGRDEDSHIGIGFELSVNTPLPLPEYVSFSQQLELKKNRNLDYGYGQAEGNSDGFSPLSDAIRSPWLADNWTARIETIEVFMSIVKGHDVSGPQHFVSNYEVKVNDQLIARIKTNEDGSRSELERFNIFHPIFHENTNNDPIGPLAETLRNLIDQYFNANHPGTKAEVLNSFEHPWLEKNNLNDFGFDLDASRLQQGFLFVPLWLFRVLVVKAIGNKNFDQLEAIYAYLILYAKSDESDDTEGSESELYATELQPIAADDRRHIAADETEDEEWEISELKKFPDSYDRSEEAEFEAVSDDNDDSSIEVIVSPGEIREQIEQAFQEAGKPLGENIYLTGISLFTSAFGALPESNRIITLSLPTELDAYSPGNYEDGPDGFEYSERYYQTELQDLLSRILVGPLDLFRELLQRLTYIGPIRRVPERDAKYQSHIEPSRWADGSAAWDVLAAADQSFIDRVSRILSDDNLLATGYELSVKKVHELEDTMLRLLREQGDESATDIESFIKEFSHHSKTKIYLTDAAGLDHDIADVGVGMAQIIPFVVAACNAKAGSAIAIEQPELHVHPAPQIGIGDLLATITDDNEKEVLFLIETHSEHILLRLLRRIRETANDELPPGAPRLLPNDLSVSYVENLDGRTVVKRLRVSDDGDFIDPWPKGFFEERIEELL